MDIKENTFIAEGLTALFTIANEFIDLPDEAIEGRHAQQHPGEPKLSLEDVHSARTIFNQYAYRLQDIARRLSDLL